MDLTTIAMYLNIANAAVNYAVVKNKNGQPAVRYIMSLFVIISTTGLLAFQAGYFFGDRSGYTKGIDDGLSTCGIVRKGEIQHLHFEEVKDDKRTEAK